jgi:hypothetical protein
MGRPNASGWTTYPDHYKLISMAIYMSPNAELTQRETYSFLEYLGDVGGLIDMLKICFALFVMSFNSNRVKAILTNRLYHLQLSKRGNESNRALNNMGKNSDKVEKRNSDEIEFGVPLFLDWQYLIFCLSCFKKWPKSCQKYCSCGMR